MHNLRPPRPTTLSLPTSISTVPIPLSHSHTHPIFPPSHHPPHQHQHQQIRHATLIRRPQRPYTFTQLVTLSDGSTFTHRTTSPAPVFRSQRDTRNTPLWNPSSQKLMNVEADEAGKLRRFREKFGRGWDASAAGGGGASGKGGGGGDGDGRTGKKKGREGDGASAAVGATKEGSDAEGATSGGEALEEDDNLLDLISGYAREAELEGTAAGVREDKTRSEKGEGGKK